MDLLSQFYIIFSNYEGGVHSEEIVEFLKLARPVMEE